MRKWIQALSLVPLLGAAFPSMATLMTGTDGALAPTTDYTLTYRADGMFDFTVFNIGAGGTVRFDTQMQEVRLLSRWGIRIAGEVEAGENGLVLKNAGGIVFTWPISVGSLSLAADRLSRAGDRVVGAGVIGGNIDLSGVDLDILDLSLRLPGTLLLQPGVDMTIRAPIIRAVAVPEPATPWLVTLLLPMLALFTRRPSI